MTTARDGTNPSRGTLGLAAATYASAGVALVTSVVLTHALDADDFGSYRYVMTVVGLAAIASNLGLPYSAARLLTQRAPAAQPGIVAASLQLLLAALVVCGVLLAVIGVATRTVLDISDSLILAALLIWTVALQRHFMYMLRGAGRTRDIAVQTITPPVIFLVSSGLLVLLLGDVPYEAVLVATGGAYLVTHLWTTTRLAAWGQRGLAQERTALLQAQHGTGLPIYKGALISVGVAELVVVLGGAAVGGDAFGEFSLALSIAAPVATLPTVIGMVQFRAFGVQGRLPRQALRSTAVRSAIVGLLGVCVGWVAFPLVFPDGFEQSRLMFPCLALSLLIHGLGDYLNQFLQAQGDGLRIKRAAYSVGAVSLLAGAIAIPILGVWGLVVAKATGSSAYAASMLTLTKRWNRAGT